MTIANPAACLAADRAPHFPRYASGRSKKTLMPLGWRLSIDLYQILALFL
ncbi:MAG: hypothetical protein WBE80_01545 [Methylocella sp.]